MRKQLIFFILVLFSFCMVQAQELVVGTYNVRYKNSDDNDAGNGWNARRNYLINLVNFQQPDLLGVQEALSGQMNDMASGFKGYSYIGVGRNDGATSGEYSAIFYRRDRMVLLDYGDFWLSDTPWKPSKGFPSKGGSTSYYRICTWGKFLDKLNGSVVYHFNTHMDLDETNRQQSFYLIKQKIQEIASTTGPVIITGDYNAVQTGEAYKLFYNSGFLYDCFNRAKQKFITNGTCPGFDANNYSLVSGEYRRIDHIFVTKLFNVEHYGVLNPCYYSTTGTASYYERAYSDHSPVLAKLTVRNPEPCQFVTPAVSDGVYQISTPEELLAFSYIVNGVAGYEPQRAAKATLLNDIDMKGMTSWLPVGTASAPYTGEFDGQGHSIQNIVIKAGRSYSGLFGYTSGATIKNFRLSGTLTVTEATAEHGTIGYATATTISDVHSALNITIGKANAETKHIGGIAGSLWGSSSVNRCSYRGKLNDPGTNTVGGIVGYADGTTNRITNAINYGTVTTKGSTTNAGGILGYVNYAGFTISHCVNVGTVTGNGNYAGQIIGRQLKAMTTPPSDLYYIDGGTLEPFGKGTDSSSAIGAILSSAEQMASGEICYKLNGDQSEINWYQTLASSDLSAEVEPDPYPVLLDTSLRVWLLGGSYTNDTPDGIESIQSSKFKIQNEGEGWYDLSGRKVKGEHEKGVYIINGKKYIKK